MTNEQYRAVQAYANSDLGELARLRMPKLGKPGKKEPSGTIDPKTAAFGTTFHSMLLEPHVPIDWTKHHVTEHDRLNHMRDAYFASLQLNDEYGLLRGFGTVEESIFWTCPETGLPLKCRPDGYPPREHFARPTVVDLKSTECRSAQDFFECFIKYGYDRQAAFYLDGYAMQYGAADARFLFIGVQKTKPYSVYYVDMSRTAERRAMLDHARAKNRRLLRDAHAESLKAEGWRPSSWSRNLIAI